MCETIRNVCQENPKHVLMSMKGSKFITIITDYEFYWQRIGRWSRYWSYHHEADNIVSLASDKHTLKNTINAFQKYCLLEIKDISTVFSLVENQQNMRNVVL